MPFALLNRHPKRRRTDQGGPAEPADPNRLDSLARRLCPEEALLSFYRLEARFPEGRSGNVKVFPIWKRYRREAFNLALMQRRLPLLRLLPLSVSGFLSRYLV